MPRALTSPQVLFLKYSEFSSFQLEYKHVCKCIFKHDCRKIFFSWDENQISFLFWCIKPPLGTIFYSYFYFLLFFYLSFYCCVFIFSLYSLFCSNWNFVSSNFQNFISPRQISCDVVPCIGLFCSGDLSDGWSQKLNQHP